MTRVFPALLSAVPCPDLIFSLSHFLLFFKSFAIFEHPIPQPERQMLNNRSMSPQRVPPLALLMLPHPSGEGIFLLLSKPASQRGHELQRSLTLMSPELWAVSPFPHCLFRWERIVLFKAWGSGDLGKERRRL